jgi:hypothetical protein
VKVVKDVVDLGVGLDRMTSRNGGVELGVRSHSADGWKRKKTGQDNSKWDCTLFRAEVHGVDDNVRPFQRTRPAFQVRGCSRSSPTSPRSPPVPRFDLMAQPSASTWLSHQRLRRDQPVCLSVYGLRPSTQASEPRRLFLHQECTWSAIDRFLRTSAWA